MKELAKEYTLIFELDYLVNSKLDDIEKICFQNIKVLHCRTEKIIKKCYEKLNL